MSWQVALCVLLAICLTTYVYIAVYRTPQSKSIERLLTRLYGGPSDGDGDGDGDDVARSDQIKRLRERLGVGLDSLPTVRFSSTGGGGGGDGGGDEDDIEMRARQHECLSVGLYISPKDDYVDCRSYCGVSDGVDYRFYDRVGLILNGRMGRAGAYCLPTDAAACNSNTALVLFTKHGWRCMPQSRAFGGEGGNMIVVCNGALLDRATGRVWRGHIDPTLSFENVDEKLPSFPSDDEHNGFRFVCPPGMKDDIGNLLIPAPFDRFILLRNSCACAIPRANTNAIRPDFETGVCKCRDDDDLFGAQYDDRLDLCVPYEAPYRRDTMESILTEWSGHRVKPCVETWSTMDTILAMTDDSSSWTQQGMRPCGIDTAATDDDEGGSETYRPAVLHNYGFIFDRPVPSPYAMRTVEPRK